MYRFPRSTLRISKKTILLHNCPAKETFDSLEIVADLVEKPSHGSLNSSWNGLKLNTKIPEYRYSPKDNPDVSRSKNTKTKHRSDFY